MGNRKPLHWEQLEEDFKQERSIALFLGAGIDFEAPHGVDYSWDALLNHLLSYAVMQLLPADDMGKQMADEMSSSAKKLIKEMLRDVDESNKEVLKKRLLERNKSLLL